MPKYRLICMSFDGDYVREGPVFDSLQEAAEHDNDMGSRWFFYPFHFPVTESGKTIADSFFPLEFLKGKRVSTVARMFEKLSQDPAMENADSEKYAFELAGAYHAREV